MKNNYNNLDKEIIKKFLDENLDLESLLKEIFYQDYLKKNNLNINNKEYYIKEKLKTDFFELLYTSIYEQCFETLNENSSYNDFLKTGFYTYIQQTKLNLLLGVTNNTYDRFLIGCILGELKKRFPYAPNLINKDSMFINDLVSLVNNNLTKDNINKIKYNKNSNEIINKDYILIDYDILKDFINITHDPTLLLKYISSEDYNQLCQFDPNADAQNILKEKYFKNLYKSIYYHNFAKITTDSTYNDYLKIAFNTYVEQLKLNIFLDISNDIYDKFLLGCVVQEMVRNGKNCDIYMYEGRLYNDLISTIKDNIEDIFDNTKKLKLTK